MRWTLRIGLALAALWAVYAASPYVALYGLAKAIERRDADEVRDRINLRAVRISLTKQIVTTYIATLDKDRVLGASDRQFAAGTALAIADPIVAQLLSPENVFAFLGDGWPEQVAGGSEDMPHFDIHALENVWRMFLASETHGFRVMTVSLPRGEPPERQFRLVLRFRHFGWRVTGIDLPAVLRQRLIERLPGIKA